MDSNGNIAFTTHGLTGEQAWQFAQFLKRASLSDYRRLAASDSEAQDMQEAGEKIRAALSEVGYSPR